MASWFLRRSGSRVSILNACRRNVPVALSLCVNPMPSRITRKSTRPRVADRTMVDTVQPRVLASFRNRSALSLLLKMQLLRWSEAKPETTGQDTRLERHSYLTRDWMPRTITRASGGGRRMFLTSPLIEQAIALRIRRECYGDFSPIGHRPHSFRIVNTTTMNTFLKIRHNWRRLEKSTVGRRLHVQP